MLSKVRVLLTERIETTTQDKERVRGLQWAAYNRTLQAKMAAQSLRYRSDPSPSNSCELGALSHVAA